MLLAGLLLAALTAKLPPAFVPPPILMYHRVDTDRPADAVGRSLTLAPEQFAAQLAFLQARGLRVISMEQFYRLLLEGRPLDRVVVATFDDGYADQYRYAVPILRRYGDCATFYIITGNIGRARHLAWPALSAMAGEGMDIAAHGVAHDDLSLMTPAQQQYQIRQSVLALRAHLRVPVNSYAYPSGRFNRETLALVHDAGVPLAVTTDAAHVIAPPSSLEMTRVRVRSGWTTADFWKAITDARAAMPIVRAVVPVPAAAPTASPNRR